MKLRALTAIVACLAFLGASAAPALADDGSKWLGASGQLEPSTSFDTNAYMWQFPNDAAHNAGGAVDRVYFNGFVIHDRFPSSDPTTHGGRIIVGDAINFGAMLGFWRDCNNDGYIGAKNVPIAYGNWNTGGYPLLASVSAVDVNLCDDAEYNHGQIIDEFRWIGPNARGNPPADGGCNPFVPFTCTSGHWGKDTYDVSDDAKVWADFGYPLAVQGSGRPIIPQGTLDDSDSTLHRVDQLFGGGLSALYDGQIADAEAETGQDLSALKWDNKPNFGECGEDKAFLGGPQNQCGLYPLYQAKRLVNDGTGDRDSQGHEPSQPLVQVFAEDGQCDSTALPGGYSMGTPAPAPHPNFLTQGSIAGTVQNIERGTDGLTFQGGAGGVAGECDYGSFPNVESTRPLVEGKHAPNAILEFYPDKRLKTLNGQGFEEVPLEVFGFFGGPSGPHDSAYGGFVGGPKWVATVTYVGGGTSGMRSALWTTLYADVSTTAFDNHGLGASATTGLPSGNDAHEYGGDECNSFDESDPANHEPNQYGWICAESKWREDPENPESPLLSIRVGKTYDLRDVDCYDQSPADAAQWKDIRYTTQLTEDSDPVTVTVKDSCSTENYLAPLQ